MQNLTTLKTVLFAALLTVPALSASAQCPGGGACPQRWKTVPVRRRWGAAKTVPARR